MSNSSIDRARRRAFLEAELRGGAPAPAQAIAGAILERHPGSAIVLYGSGLSVLKGAPAEDVLYDFYVIAPSYAAAYPGALLRLANRLIPPNVFYIEHEAQGRRLRAKYAVLSIGHFEKLVSRRTFHSYFWARFAQPCRIVCAPPDLAARIVGAVEVAIDAFVARSAPLAGVGGAAAIGEVWRAGLERSYRAELRAEQPDRVARLLASYGDWPARATIVPEISAAGPSARRAADLAWRMRAVLGGLLSVLRLLKGVATFEGGVDYIAWKISRHAGFQLPVRAWERRWPVLGAPFLARRYYRMRRERAAAQG